MKIITNITVIFVLILSILVLNLYNVVHELEGFVGAQSDFNHEVRKTMESANPYQRTYADGVNNALETITLLNLEQHLYQTNRTFGEMSDIVRERLRVSPK